MIFYIIKAFLLIIEALFLIIFTSPLLKNIGNIGNIVGIIITLTLMIITIFSSKVWQIIISLWEHLAGKITLIIVFSLILIVIIWCVCVSIRMVKAFNNVPTHDTTVVVLGCKVNENSVPSKMLRLRIEAAFDYLKTNENIMCIASGGKGDNEDISEAECIKNELVKRGIDEIRIIMEERSENTYQNINYSYDIILKNNLAKDITIVTDGFHELRASIIAKKLDINSYSVCAKTPTIDLPYYWIRELMGLFQEMYLKK